MMFIRSLLGSTAMGMVLVITPTESPVVEASRPAIEQYMAICTEKAEHEGREYLLSSWLDAKERADSLGKAHERATRGHRWRIATRAKPTTDQQTTTDEASFDPGGPYDDSRDAYSREAAPTRIVCGLAAFGQELKDELIEDYVFASECIPRPPDPANTSVNVANATKLVNYTKEAIGSQITVCVGQRIPSGWTQVSQGQSHPQCAQYKNTPSNPGGGATVAVLRRVS